MKNFNIKLYVLAPLTLAVVLLMWFLPASSFGIEGLTVVQQRTIAIFCYAALMWMFEIIPAWATSVTTIVFLLIAVSNKGLANETMGWLVLLKNKECITGKAYVSMSSDCNELIAMLVASVNTSKKNQQIIVK